MAKRKPTLSELRAAAGRKGARAKWARLKGREVKTMTRLYKADVKWLKTLAPTIADAVRGLRTALEKIAHYADDPNAMDDPNCADGHECARMAREALHWKEAAMP